MKLKVIARDNLNREGPGHDDVLICIAESEAKAEKIVKALNALGEASDYGGTWYAAVDVCYKLQEFEP